MRPGSPDIFPHCVLLDSLENSLKKDLSAKAFLGGIIHGSLSEEKRRRVTYKVRDFPGDPVAKTPQSQSRVPGFNLWSGN